MRDRHTISVSAATYDRLEIYAEVTNRSVSSIVEERVNLFLDRRAGALGVRGERVGTGANTAPDS